MVPWEKGVRLASNRRPAGATDLHPAGKPARGGQLWGLKVDEPSGSGLVAWADLRTTGC